MRARVNIHLGIEKEGDVCKYLCLPEHFDRKKKDLFAYTVDRIKQRSINWYMAWKANMLQSLSCFQLHVCLCKKIQSILTSFW